MINQISANKKTDARITAPLNSLKNDQTMFGIVWPNNWATKYENDTIPNDMAT